MDIALAVEKLLGVAEYGTATTYADLAETWRDSRNVPTEAELEAAWAEMQTPSIDDQIAAIEAKYEVKFAEYDKLATRIINAGGADKDAKLADLSVKYNALSNQMNLEMEAVLLG